MKKLRTREIVGFLLLEALLYARFLWLDFRDIANDGYISVTALKYLAICLCFLTSLHWAQQGGSTLQAFALGFTLAADTFLLLLDRWYIAGLACFCAAQAFYLARILRRNGGHSLWIIRLVLLAAVLAALWYFGQFIVLNVLCALYFTTFLLTAIQSLPLRGAGCLKLGLLLYLLCDICVGVCNSPAWFGAAARHYASLGMWLFYLPGQALLAVSGARGGKAS